MIVLPPPPPPTPPRPALPPSTRPSERTPSAAPRNRRALLFLGTALCLLTPACSSPETQSGDPTTPDSGAPDATTGDPNILAGAFQVRRVAPIPASGSTPETPGYTAVVGKIYDGSTPSQIIWEEAAKEGACLLSTPRVPFCNTPCGGSAACVEDDTCQPYPAAHSAGKVTARGLHTDSGATEFVMEPVVNSYQPPAGVNLPYPAFSEGEELSFEASGEYWSAFTLKAKGISPLTLLNDTIQLDPDQPVKLTWTPPGQAGISTIHVKLDISHHGGTKGMIECDADDTGSLDLPAALLTQLKNLGVAGYPTIIVTRKAVGSTTIAPGRVDLVVSSGIERPVTIPGLTSCTDDTDCSGGQTCQSDLTCK